MKSYYPFTQHFLIWEISSHIQQNQGWITPNKHLHTVFTSLWIMCKKKAKQRFFKQSHGLRYHHLQIEVLYLKDLFSRHHFLVISVTLNSSQAWHDTDQEEYHPLILITVLRGKRVFFLLKYDHQYQRFFCKIEKKYIFYCTCECKMTSWLLLHTSMFPLLSMTFSCLQK